MVKELLKNSEWEILTPDGWSDFDGLVISENETIQIEFCDGTKISCTKNHQIKFDDGSFKKASDIKINDKINQKIVTSISDGLFEKVYDPINVRFGNQYLSNDLIHHNCVILDEFAFLQKSMADEFFTSIFPTISSGKTTKMLIISTPKGLNHFYKMYTDASEKRSEFVPIEINWDEVPGRDEKFKQETIKNFGLQKWKQEFECQWLGSSSTLIDSATISSLAFVTEEDIMEGIKIYERPREDRIYFITVDPSEGKMQDNHAFIVFDVTERPFKVVATWKNNETEPLMVPEYVYYAAKMYNDAYVLVETKSSGGQIADEMFHTKQYHNMLGAKAAGRRGQVLTSYNTQKARGLDTSKTTKSIGCSNLKLIVENEQIFLNDFDIVNELSNFVLKHGTYKADEGHHDDLVMCLVLFAWATTQDYFKNFTDVDVKEILEEKRKKLEEEFLPIFIMDGQDEFFDDGEEFLF